MKLSKTVVAFSLSAALSLYGSTAEAQIDPLRLVVACTPDLTFQFTIQNVGTAPTAVVIGSILGNDKKYLPGKIRFTLRRPGAADTNFDYFDPSVPRVTGQIDPWLIPLPPSASYSIIVAIPRGFRGEFSTSAAVTVHLTTHENEPINPDTKGLEFIHVWVGTLTSNAIRFPDDCTRK
jgi:hypothetical protein